MLGHGRAVVNDLAVLSGIDTTTYQPANGAAYPSSSYGRQLRQIAQLIKAEVSLEVACLDLGGWESHFGQVQSPQGYTRDLAGARRGGKLGRDWPGLASDQLKGAGDLRVTIDYRDLLGEVVGEADVRA